MINDLGLLLEKGLVSIITLFFILLGLQLQELDLLLKPIDLFLEIVDLLRAVLIVLEQLVIGFSLGLSVRNELLEVLLKLIIKCFDLLNQVMLHRLEVFHVLIFNSLTFAFKSRLHVLHFLFLFFSDGLDHVAELLCFLRVLTVNLSLFGVKL